MEGETERSTQARREAALRRANQVRHERAAIKRSLRAGELSVSELLGDPPGVLRSAKLDAILRAAPGYGEVRVGRLLKRCRVSPRKTVGALSERQRRQLVRALDG